MNHDPANFNAENPPATGGEMAGVINDITDTFGDAYADAVGAGHKSVRYELGEEQLAHDPLGFRFRKIAVDYRCEDDPDMPGQGLVTSAKFIFATPEVDSTSITHVIGLREHADYADLEESAKLNLEGMALLSSEVSDFADVSLFGEVWPQAETQEDLVSQNEQAGDGQEDAVKADTRVRQEDLANIRQLLDYIDRNDPQLMLRSFPEP